MSNFRKKRIGQAVTECIISVQQASALLDRFEKTETRSNFNAANVAYYFGSFIVISAMTWFMTAA